MEVILYNSTVCRLCGEENDNGTLLFSSDDNSQNLCELINKYLPIKVVDDGQLPRTICPGCTIQLEATIEFLNLIINGQKVIRLLLRREEEYKKNLVLEPIQQDEIVTEEIVYGMEHPVSLQMAGLEKPKRKRGRPPKKSKSNDVVTWYPTFPSSKKEVEEYNGKRRRKTPTRFKEVIQGKELERIFKEEGVIDGEDSDNESKQDNPPEVDQVMLKEPVVIGHLENSGELVVVCRGKGRGRPKGRIRQTHEVCAICGMVFSCVGRYMSHVAQHGPVLYQCFECRETFTTRLNFKNHQLETQHTGQDIIHCDNKKSPTKKVQSKKKPPVDQEEDPLASVPSIVNNVVTAQELPQLTCLKLKDNDDSSTEDNKVPKSEDTEAVTETHDSNPSKDVPNDSSAEVADDVAVNDSKEEENEPSGKQKLKCNLCDKMFSTRQSKSMHIKAVHKGERPYRCGECGGTFAYPRSLALHALSHRRPRAQPARGYGCDLCGKVLNHPSSVAYHKEAEHAGQRYVCSKCGKCFKHKQLLTRHQLVHTQLRPYHCKTCNSSFKTKANLVNHQQLHLGVKKFSCELCKHRFAHKTSLTLHMRWHTGQKPFSCEKCGKTFSQKGNLSEHERIHTGEKPYECQICHRRFTTSSQHRLHARRHQPEKDPGAPPAAQAPGGPGTPPATGGPLPGVQRTRTVSRRAEGAGVACGECRRVFPTSAALRRHARRHTGERPHRCPHCARAFADASNLNKHKKQVHKQVSLLVNEQVQHQTQLAPQLQTQLVPQIQTQLPPQIQIQLAPQVQSVQGHQQGQLQIQLQPQLQTLLHPQRQRQLLPKPEPQLATGLQCRLETGLESLQPPLETELELEIPGSPASEPEEHVIYVAYDIDSPAYRVLDPEQVAELMEEKIQPPRPIERTHTPVTDEDGNPLHFTMDDGTRLAITFANGKSLQIVTPDGQSIPVEINPYEDDVQEEVSSEPTVGRLKATIQDPSDPTQVAQFFSIV